MSFYSDLNYLKPNKGPILEDIDAIWQSIYSILGTKPGTRVFRRSWGGNLSRYLFEPCDEITARSMMYDIEETLKQEPRATLNMGESNVIPDPENSQFYIILSFDIPGFSDYEKTITLTFKQRN